MSLYAHDYLGANPEFKTNENKTLKVIWLTASTMGLEIFAGLWSGSMALLADGWHMASHAGALFIAYLAYRMARRPGIRERYSYGAGKFIPLGGYTSALLLAVMAGLMIVESTERIFSPMQIHFDEAIAVAVLGLAVNLVSAWILGRNHGHSHDHGHAHSHSHEQEHHHEHSKESLHDQQASHSVSVQNIPLTTKPEDHNIRGAYLHVLTDALTSVLAIFALISGKFLGYVWLDPAIGIVGGFVVLKWAWGLGQETARELLDKNCPLIQQKEVEILLQKTGAEVLDFHAWKIAPGTTACTLIVSNATPKGAEHYHDLLKNHFDAAHLTVEERKANPAA